MKKVFVGLTLAGLLVLGTACGTATATDEPVTDAAGFPVEQVDPVAPITSDAEVEMVADMVQAEATASGDWAIFCEGLTVLDYELAYSYFVDGFGADNAESRAAFDELASRC